MDLDFYHIDAFTDETFKGNPAAVFILDAWLSEALMQTIAAEFNLSETVFVVNEGKQYRIRWFTPEAEVSLCGHATLASTHVLREHVGVEAETIEFQSLSGLLKTSGKNGAYTLDFPATPASPVNAPEGLATILGAEPVETLATNKLLAIFKAEQDILDLKPDFRALANLDYQAICVSAPATTKDLDFVCRFFAPKIGIDEDPVTGSAYTILTPYYAGKTGKTDFKARQLSQRGGDLSLSLQGDRVLISGKAKTVMSGVMHLD